MGFYALSDDELDVDINVCSKRVMMLIWKGLENIMRRGKGWIRTIHDQITTIRIIPRDAHTVRQHIRQ